MPEPSASKQQATKLLLSVEGVGGGGGEGGEVSDAGRKPSAAGAKDPGKIGGMGKAAADKLLELVYDDCRRLAASYLQRENAGHTLQPTALAHEVYMRLIEQDRVDWKGRTHFMAIAAQAMRRLLIDHARGRDRQKRGGGWKRVSLDGGSGSSSRGSAIADPRSKKKHESEEVDVEKLDAILAELAELDERQAQIVTMRFLGGMTVEEVAIALGISKRTVEGDWTMARAWLRKRLAEEAED
jgi:RNA polymerase sigma factor (TIGR02999 family)